VLLSLAWSSSLLTMAGYEGIVDPDMAKLSSAGLPLSLYRFFSPSPTFDIALVLLSNLIAVFGALLFLWPRSSLASLAMYLSLVSFKQTVPLMSYGVFEFLQLGLFYVMAANVAHWIFRRNDDVRWRADRLVGWFFRGHLAMGYLFSGLSKAVGPHWWTGESMWRALARTDNSGQRWFDSYWTGNYPLLLQIAGIVSVLLETFYPLAFFRKLRWVIVPGIMLMHLGTIAAQGLTLFGLTMISLNLFFILESTVVERAGKKGRLFTLFRRHSNTTVVNEEPLTPQALS